MKALHLYAKSLIQFHSIMQSTYNTYLWYIYTASKITLYSGETINISIFLLLALKTIKYRQNPRCNTLNQIAHEDPEILHH